MTTATHGRLALGTPWSRAISPEDKAAVEQLLPEDYVLGVSVEANKGRWLLWLVKDGEVLTDKLKVTRRLPHGAVYPLRAACEFALRHWGLA